MTRWPACASGRVYRPRAPGSVAARGASVRFPPCAVHGIHQCVFPPAHLGACVQWSVRPFRPPARPSVSPPACLPLARPSSSISNIYCPWVLLLLAHHLTHRCCCCCLRLERWDAGTEDTHAQIALESVRACVRCTGLALGRGVIYTRAFAATSSQCYSARGARLGMRALQPPRIRYRPCSVREPCGDGTHARLPTRSRRSADK